MNPTIALLQLTAMIEEAERKRKNGELPPVEPIKGERQVQYRAGRNEPCPCGSGKKFKKCHGG